MEILVFKTDIHNDTEVEAISPILETLPMVSRWNVDLQDVDKILRIESKETACARNIESVLQKAGFYCEELPD
ncbi:MAG: hypothetical protein ACO1NW_06365 [Chitinophagaceae bacterium]